MYYKITKAVKQHNSDVRGVCLLSNNQFLTTSRDTTSIIWEYNESEVQPVRTLVGHTHYVCSCCFIRQSSEHPEGLIITGGNDSIICVYNPSNIEPLFKLKGHTNAVSALTETSQNTFASGSWDTKIMIWEITNKKCTTIIQRHEGSVFAILLFSSGQIMLSASGDKTINVYSWPELDVLRMLTGHEDCVRGLAELCNDEFLSCSNDGTIRKWNALTGVMLATIFINGDFLYSIDSTKDGSLTVSCGENSCLVIIDGNSGQIQTMKLPSLTVWSVRILPNTDVLACCSDGYVRIFAANPISQEPTLESVVTNDEQVEEKNGQENLDVAVLPGAEALTKPGLRDGQILLIQENGKAVCYQWSEGFFNWMYIGDVTGSDENNQETAQSNKIMFEGKEYDYLFDVDLRDGGPLLKLPYSRETDPYEAASEFLKKHNLPFGYLSEVINFIRRNTAPAQPMVSTSSIQQLLSPEEKKIKDSQMILFPTDQYVVFSFVDEIKIKGKLIEFESLVRDSINTEEQTSLEMEKIIKMAVSDDTPPDDVLDILNKCLDWPHAYIYPVLDLVRVAMTHEAPNSRICQYLNIHLSKVIITYIEPTCTQINNMLTLKILSNMILFTHGQEFMLQHIDSVLKTLKILSLREEKTVSFELAISSLILNLVIMLIKKNEIGYLTETLGVALGSLSNIKQKDAPLRLLVAIGTACSRVDKIYMIPSTKNYLESLAKIEENDEVSLKIKTTASKILEGIQPKLLISKGSKAN